MIIVIVHSITPEKNQSFDKRRENHFVKVMQRDCNRLYKLISKEMISRSDKPDAKEAEYIIDCGDKSLLFQVSSEIMQTLK